MLSELGNIVHSIKGLVDEGVIVSRRVRWSMIRLANNEPTIANNWVTHETTIYVAKSRKYLTASLSTADINAIKSRVQGLIKELSDIPEDEFYVPLVHGEKPNQLIGKYDSKVESEIDKLIDGLNEAIQASLSEGSQRNAGAMTFGIEERYYVDSTGLELEDKASFVTLTIRAFIDDLTATSVSISNTLNGFKPRTAGTEAGHLVSLAKDLPEESVSSGRYGAVLSPLVSAHLYGVMTAMWFNAYSVITEMSGISKNDIGNSIASEDLSVVDLSNDPNAFGSESFDYEGNKTVNVEVIRRGILAGLLHNNRTAAKFNVTSTGHAVGNWLRPRPRHVAVSIGHLPNDIEVIATELGNGIIITNNWYTRFQNVREGIFSTVVRDAAFLVKNGKLSARVRGLRIADSFRTLLRNFVDASKETNQVYWWDSPLPGTAPYVLIRDLNISKG
ncbi:TldD/PmbA family protein [Vulcanisaeta souniana]|uniref:Peptidase C69 n=1 Tax=Vulcanisaeta souniana JCM 11219 TaxID=1293586 RepID=A0A830E1K7_9CREN|nr:TldD/PmbA family protein [Vulcanisaeta souniana]BDR91500.1 peptidase C69 [Vulcanisaeta souniana JCM 11219]GGI73677.1 peptidase C69 [Vulcanisaeta souniana JCM 11219]